ncbi:hypothetical protein [Ferviditalea candida]|uniref:Uncharacterized protein n=1 Tax=Ferviditalea candida TaxID=3108399 RepID=A0ABU5ZNG6_9BACL|nr:hypothetical protein [Paenibacillaceae bacterium T2]
MAKKVGLLATILIFAKKLWFLIIAGLAVIPKMSRKVFGRRTSPSLPQAAEAVQEQHPAFQENIDQRDLPVQAENSKPMN